jgi:hypothetical protein
MDNVAPVNVMLENPTIALDGWENQTRNWLSLNQDIGGNPGFYPLTIKAAYVIGVIYTLCESVTILLKAPNAKLVSYIPAFGVLSSGIELLGRCLRGDPGFEGSTADLRAGYRWLASCYFANYRGNYETVPPEIVLIQTRNYGYSITNLVALRHFAAHGQASSREIIPGSYEFGYIDFEIMEHIPHLLANGLESYWNEILVSETMCNNLAMANVIALRRWPVFQSWLLFEKDQSGKYQSITDRFSSFDWKIS